MIVKKTQTAIETFSTCRCFQAL